MELHEQEECPKAVRACPFAEFGCDFKVSVSQCYSTVAVVSGQVEVCPYSL